MRSLIQVYALAVCFCALMCLVIALGFGLYDVVRISAPSFTMNQFATVATNEQYLLYHADKTNVPEAEVTRLRKIANDDAIDNERRAAGQGFVFALIIAAIAAVVYAIHWRLAKKSEMRLVSSSHSN